jgi:hypothetical protein
VGLTKALCVVVDLWLALFSYVFPHLFAGIPPASLTNLSNPCPALGQVSTVAESMLMPYVVVDQCFSWQLEREQRLPKHEI